MDWKLFTKVGALALVAVVMIVAISTGNAGTVAVLAPVALQVVRKF